jgi:hypothetical protein
MELTLKRIAKRRAYTIGRLYIVEGAKEFITNTLEPPVIEQKTRVGKEAVLRARQKLQSLKPVAIPEGRYAVVITWSPKFEEWLPLLVGDQRFNNNFQGIRIHAGNCVGHTQGCILVGENLTQGMVYNSRRWLKRIKDRISEAKERGEAVWLTVE